MIKQGYFIMLVFCIMSLSHLHATNYYVNNGVLNGDDIYTTAVGSAANTGLTPNSPKALPSQIISLGVLAGGDTVFIDAGGFVDELLIDAINGSAGNYIVFTGVDSTKTLLRGVVGTNASAPVAPRELVVQVHNSDYISIENMKLLEAPGSNDWVLQFYNGSSNNIVKNVYIEGFYGIDIEAGANTFNEIADCYIYAQHVGVRLKNGADDNHIHDCTIIIDDGAFFAAIEMQSANDNLIERCIIATTGTSSEATVHGGKWSTGNKFYNNYIINYTAGELAVDSDFGDEIDFVHNSIYSAGDGINYQHITAGDHVVDLTLESNIIYAAGGYPIILPDVNDKFTLVDNNLFYSSTGDVAEIGGVGYDLAAWVIFDPDGAGGATNSLYGDPGFNDFANLDLSIGAGSPAYNASTNSRAFALDINQNARPYAGVRDVGAYEFSALPIELGYFRGSCIDQNVRLEWLTLSETNNDFFSIESALDGSNFELLSFIGGAGNSNGLLMYEFNSTQTNGYFRLKQTDFDGEFSYSEMIYTNCSSGDLVIHVVDHVVDVSLPINSDVKLQLWSLNGQLLYECIKHSSGQTLSAQLPPVASGVYMLSVQSGSEFISQKVRF